MDPSPVAPQKDLGRAAAHGFLTLACVDHGVVPAA
jgi:hypothetical protein